MAKILIIDDNATNRKVLVALLEHERHQTIEASDGAEGLAAARTHRPNLVISDILMPTMDGYEFVRQLRSDPHSSATPVIFHTAHYHEREARRLAQTCNVEHVLAKPTSASDILAAVKHALGEATPLAPSQVDTEFDREHLRLITNKLSESVDELRATNARLAALIDINVQLASERDPQLLLEKVCHAARELLGARFAVLAATGPSAAAQARFTTSGIDRSVTHLEAPNLEAGSLGMVLKERHTLRVSKTDGFVTTLGLPQGYPQAQAFLAAPLCSISRTYGWVCLGDKTGACEFTADDERILATLGAQVGRIYENGRLYREVETHAAQLVLEMEKCTAASARIQHLNRVYAVLSGINSLIVRVRDRKQLLHDAARLAVDTGHFRFAWVGLLGASGQEFQHTAWAGGSEAFARSLGLDPVPRAGVETLVMVTLKSQQPEISHDSAADPRVAGYQPEISQRGYRSLLALPLIVGGKSVGCMVLARAERGFFDDQELPLLIELAGDISFALDHIEKSERLNYLAYYDELTGIANRTFFHERLAMHVTAASRTGSKLALVVAQVERFDSVGESLGRAAVDQLVRELADRFSRCVGDAETVARIGPDIFAAIIPDITHESDIVRAIDAWWPQWLGPAFKIEGHEVCLAARAGVAVFPGDSTDADELIKHAEAALKKARLNGDRYLFYTQRLSERGSQKLALESRLRRALENEEFVLHYQPKVDLENRGVTGVEALLRWCNADMGLIQPSQFIPLMEETGIIVDVGAWALRQACLDRSRWLELGLKAPRIAVNVSTVQLRRKEFVRIVKNTLRTAGSEAGIDIEVTESLIMEDADDNIAKLAAIRDLGVRIAIDDFGTGYSSLGYLTKLPVQVLKIDRSFVTAMLEDPSAMTLVSTIISLAHALRLEVVAEGVESEEQAKILRLVRCEQMQGYLISRPLPFDDMTTFLQRPQN